MQGFSSKERDNLLERRHKKETSFRRRERCSLGVTPKPLGGGMGEQYDRGSAWE